MEAGGFPAPEPYSYSAPIGAVCFDPSRPNVLYAGIGRPRFEKEGRGQVYKSADGGESWRLTTPQGALDARAVVSDLEAAPDGTFVLAATDKGIYRSDGRGETWSASNNGLRQTNVRELAVAPSDPRIVYCTLRTTARDSAAWDGGVWRSDDRGRTWQERNKGLAQTVGKRDQPAELTSQYKEIVVHPRDPDTVYVGDSSWVSAGVSRTTDGGRSWTMATRHDSTTQRMDYGWIAEWGPSVESLAISPARPERLVFGTAGHVFASDDGGTSWQQRYCHVENDHVRGNGLEVTCFNRIVADPKSAGRFYFCYFDIGLLISDDNGRTFRQAVQGMKHKGNCFTVIVDPDDGTLWAGTGAWGTNEGDVCRSLDQGRTWSVVGRPESGLPAGQTKHLVLDRSSPAGARTLYVTSKGNGVYKSENGGISWRSIGAGLPESSVAGPCGLLINPADARHLRLALGGSPSRGGGTFETRDGGQSWRKTNDDAVLADIQDFQADPKNFDTLYICQREFYDRSVQPPVLLPGGLYKSTDGGKRWSAIYASRFASCVALSPVDSRTLYVGTTDHPFHDECRAQGVFVSMDGGQTWRQEVNGLSCWNVSCICVDPHEPSRVYLGTAGNGAFVGAVRAAH